MASKTYNYLVTIDLDSGSPKRYALLRVQCPAGWSGLGLSGVYESRLLEEPSISHDIGDPWGGIVNSSQVTLRFNDPAGDFTDYFDDSDLRLQDIIVHEYEYGTTENPRSLFAGCVKSISADCDSDGTVVVTLNCESFKTGLLDTMLPKISYTNDNQWESEDKYKVAEEFGARFPAIISGTREHVPCIQVRANPTVPSYKYVIAHDIAGERIYQQQPPAATYITLGCQTSLNNLYRLSSDDSKLRVIDLGVVDGAVTIQRELANYESTGNFPYLTATADKNLRARLYADIETCELDINGLSGSTVAAFRFKGNLDSDDFSANPYRMVARRFSSVTRNHDFRFSQASQDEGEYDNETGLSNKVVYQEITGCGTPPCKPVFTTGRDGTANTAIAIYKNTPLFTDNTHRAYQYDGQQGAGAVVFSTTSVYIEAQVRMNTTQTLSNGNKIKPGLDGCLFAQPYTANEGHGGIYFYVSSTGLSASAAMVDTSGPPWDARKFGYVSGDYVFKTGTWYVIGFEIERQTSQAVLRLYVDGVAIGESTLDVPSTGWSLSNQLAAPAASVAWRLFNDNAYDAGHTGFQGIVDRVQLYNSTRVATVQFLGGMTGQSISAIKLESAYDVAVSDGTDADTNGTGRNALGLGAGDHLALMCWFKHPKLPDAPTDSPDKILATYGSYSTTSPGGWRILLGGDNNGIRGAMCFAINTGTFYRTPTGGYDDDKWHQLWIIANNSTNQVTVRVDDSEWTTSMAFSSITAGQILNFGTTTANNSWIGSIDEFVILKNSSISALPNELFRTTQYYTAKGNPAMVLARVLGSMPWGLGSNQTGKYQIIDYDPLHSYASGTRYPILTNSFGDVAAKLDGYDLSLNGALSNERKAADLVDQICSIFGITVWFDGVKWMCGLVWDNTDSTHLLGWKDGSRQNVDKISYSRTSADNVPQSVIVRFGRVTDMERNSDKAYLFETEKKTIANGKGEEKRYLDFDLIRKPDVADRVCAYYAGWWAGDRQVEAEIQKTNFEDIVVGDMAQLEATQVGIGSAYTNDDFRVFSVQRSPDFGMKVKLYEDMKAIAVDGYSPPGGGYTSVVDQDLQADYRFTSPPPPTAFHCVDVSYWSHGAICAFSFTAPAGQIAEEALSHCVLMWQERPSGSDAGTNDFNWHTVNLFARPGSTYIWITRDFVPTHTYAVQLYAVTYYGQASIRATVVEAGKSTTANQVYGIPGRTELVITPPADAAVTNGAYIWEQGGLGSGSATYKITPLPAFDGDFAGPFSGFFPDDVDISSAGQEPIIILDNAWYNWKASAPGVFEFSTSGTGNRDVTFGRAPDTGAVAYAIVKPA